MISRADSQAGDGTISQVMFSWPSLTKVLSVWSVATFFACVAYVLHARSLPPGDLAIASTLEFQAMMSFIIVALPSGVCLLFFLAVGALMKGWVTKSRCGDSDAAGIDK